MQPILKSRPACPLQTSRFIAAVEQKINRRGLTVECLTDFAELDRQCDQIDDKPGATEPFSTRFFDITPAQGFWLRGTDPAGRVAHVQAMRCDQIDGMSLADYWSQQLRRIHCDPNPGAKLRNGGAPAAQMISGKVVYHGEMWLADHLRGQGLGGLLSRLALGLAVVRWAPDYIYGFVHAELVKIGFPIREGYMHMQPDGIAWEQAPPNINADDWIVWMGRDDLAHLMAQSQVLESKVPARMLSHS